MSIHVALYPHSHYRYDRSVAQSPRVIRLRLASHCRSRLLSHPLISRLDG